MTDYTVLAKAQDRAIAFLKSLPARAVSSSADLDSLRSKLAIPLADDGVPSERVISELAQAAEAGLVATAGPRYFGFVIGGSLPAALAADWLTSTWDQNAGLYVSSPAAAVVEEVAASWLLDLLGLPANASVGFVTGGMMANFTALAAARHEVLRRTGWDVEEDGLHGGPPVQVVASEEAHITIFAALSMLGLGRRRVKRVPTDDQGRMRQESLRQTLATCDGPTIVCAQAGNVNTGAIDPLDEIATLSHERGAWLHVDGAFGLWASVTPSLRPHLQGVDRADSWALDAHKWLNVPYDSGIAIVADPNAHRAAMTVTAPYLVQTQGKERDPLDWAPEFSRRARGFPVYAALRALGRRGVTELVERCCRLARQMAEQLNAAPGVEILNEVVLNQVLVRFHPRGRGDPDALTRAVIARVQRDGTCWLGGTTWHGMAAMRVSVSNWSTTEDDITQSADAILRAAREEMGSDPQAQS